MDVVIFDIQYFASDVKLTAENDEYSNSESDQIIYALGGNDKIFNVSDNVTINGDANNDLIINGQFFARGGTNVELNGGNDNDTITNSGSYSKIDGGAGDDLIHNGYYYYEPWNAYYNNSGSDGAYDDKLKSSHTTIYGGSGNDSIYNRADNVTIDAGTGNNHIYSEGSNVVINVDGGKNTIEGDNIKINGGKNNDSISCDGKNITINGGTGNDTLTGDRYTDVFQYDNGGGDDVITNYSGEDVIHIASGKINSYSFDGGDLIFHIGDGSLRLKNMLNHAITVKDSSGKNSTKIYGNGYHPQQVIRNFVSSLSNSVLNGTSAIDEAFKASSDFNSLEDFISKMIEDCRIANNGDTFLSDYCGIFNYNSDAGAITGWDNGGLKMKTTAELMKKSTNKLVYPRKNTFTIRGLTVNIPEKNTLSKREQRIIKEIYSWGLDVSLQLVKASYGFDFEKNPCSITLGFYRGDDPIGAAWAAGYSLTIVPSIYNFDEDYNWAMSNFNGMLPHELTHIAQYHWIKSLPGPLVEGMANIVSGGDPSTEDVARNPNLLAQYLDPNKGGLPDNNAYIVGTMFCKYLMRQASESYDSLKSYAWKDNSVIKGTAKSELLTFNANKVSISGGKGKDTITAYGKNSTISGDSGNDYILVGSTAKKITVSGGKGNDSISSEGDKVKIYGNDGKDSISCYGTNVTIISGAGADIISSESNKAKIYGNDGNDSISNRGDNSKIYGNSGSDRMYNYADKSTLQGGTGNDFIINGQYWESEKGGKNVKIYSNSGADTITSHGTKSLLSGGTGNDVIYNGYRYYESGNSFYDYDDENYRGSDSTVIGGTGDDTIKNKGISVKLYGNSGKDQIYNYADKSTLQGGASDDFIINGQYWEGEKGGQSVVINGGSGKDTITSHGKNSVLKGGNGNDLIYNGFRYYEPWTAFYDYDDKNYKGDNTTITGGKGNDTVSLSSYAVNNVINYASGDGEDTVFGFDSNDTLHITKGNYSAKAVGSDVIVTIGKGSICLKDAANKKISIKNLRNNITKKNYKDTSVADLWIEDNFVISDNLSGIVKNNLSPTDDSFESQNFSTLNQKDLIFGQSYLNGICERK